MPFVTANAVYGKNGGGHWGPFQRSNGDLVVFTLSTSSDWSTQTQVHVSDDEGQSWSSGATTNWGNRVLCFWAEYDAAADVFHTACHVEGGTVHYNTYDPATDTWGTRETVNAHSNGNSPGFGVVLKLHPTTGNVWFLYQDDHENIGGTNYRRIGLAERTAAHTYTTWGADPGGTNHYTVGDMAWHDGTLHILYGTWATRPFYRTFDPATETFGSPVDLTGANVTFAVNVARRIALYDAGGVTRAVCSYRGASSYPTTTTVDDGSAGSPEAITSTAVAVWDSGNDAALTLIPDPDEDTVYALFADSATGDVWLDSNTDDAGWGADTEIADGVTARYVDATLFVNGSNEVVLGVIYDQPGVGVTYEEVYLRDAGGAEPVTVDVQAATVQTSAPALTVEPGEAAIDLEPAGLMATAPPLSVDVGAVLVDLSVAQVAAAGLPLTVLAGEAVVGLRSGEIAVTAPLVEIAPGAAIVDLYAAKVTISALPVTPETGTVVTLGPAQVALVAHPVEVEPGAVEAALHVAAIAVLAPPIEIAEQIAVLLNPAQLTLTAPPFIVSSGAATVWLNVAVLEAVGPRLQVLGAGLSGSVAVEIDQLTVLQAEAEVAGRVQVEIEQA